jgi:hypothetical protein
MLLTCISTVRGLRNSSRAISRLVRPVGHHPDDLHLAARQTSVLELRGRSLTKPPFGPFAQRVERASELVGQRLRAEPSSGPIGGDEVLHGLFAPAGSRKDGCSAAL